MPDSDRAYDDLHRLTLTAYPPGPGPCEHWELTADATGEVVAKGLMPVDDVALGETCRAWHERVDLETDLLVLAHRSPTPAMLEAARDWSYRKYGMAIGNDAAIGCWQAMLGAALSWPKPGGGS